MSMFHHSLYSQHNSRKPYLNKSLIVPQNDNFFKNLFNRKYVKFIIKLSLTSEMTKRTRRPYSEVEVKAEVEEKIMVMAVLKFCLWGIRQGGGYRKKFSFKNDRVIDFKKTDFRGWGQNGGWR